MAHRDEDRLHARSSAHHLADHLAAVAKLGVGPATRPGFPIIADEPALGAAEGRQIEKHPEVAGQAESAGMRSPLAIADDQVRHCFELREGLQQRGDLPEGQKPRNVGKAGPGPDTGDLHHLQALCIEHHHRGVEIRAAAVEGDVGAGHQSRQPLRVPLDHPTAQTLLESPGLGNGEIPVVADPWLQRWTFGMAVHCTSGLQRWSSR